MIQGLSNSELFSAASKAGSGSTVETTGVSGAGSVNTSAGITFSQSVNNFGLNVVKNLSGNLAGTLINSAITGTPITEKSLQSALTGALITAGLAAAANTIGDNTERFDKDGKLINPDAPLNAYTQAVAHAIVGCVGGIAAAGNKNGCGAGAIGAVVGELTAQYAINNSSLNKDQIVALARSVSATAGLLVSNGDASSVNVAAQLGANAAENNFCSNGACQNRRFNWFDAVEHWRNGDGAGVTDVNVSELNFKDATFTKIADGVYRISTPITYDTGVIYGTVTGFVNPDGTLSLKPDTYNFDFKNPFGNIGSDSFWRLNLRNLYNGLGLIMNGFGTPYRIEFTGSVPFPAGVKK